VLQADKTGERTKPMAHKVVASIFRLPYARTIHAAQGLEWPRVRIWGWDSPNFTLSHLVVGMSRRLAADALDFGPPRAP